MAEPIHNQLFAYKPLSNDFEGGWRKITELCQTDIMSAAVQQVGPRADLTLRSHAELDGFYMVLEGRARFYGDGRKVIGEFGKNEGVLVPRTYQYSFESIGEEPLQLLQIYVSTVPVEGKFLPPWTKPGDFGAAEWVSGLIAKVFNH